MPNLTLSSQSVVLTDSIDSLTEVIARLQTAVVLDASTHAATPEAALYRTRLTQSLRSLRVIRGGLVGLQAVLMGQVAL